METNMKTFKEKTFEEKFEELEKFCEKNDRLPRASVESEKQYLNFLRWGIKNNIVGFKELNDKYKKKPINFSYSEVESWYTKYGKNPVYKKNGDKYENDLFMFIKVKVAQGEQEYIALFKTHKRSPGPGEFKYSYEYIKSWCESHGRLPTQTTQEEKSLSKVISYRIARDIDKEKYLELKKKYSRRVTSFEDLINFCEREGRMPSGGGNRKRTKEEYRLYNFLHKHGKSEEVIKLKEKYGKVFNHVTTKDYIDFCEREGRMPARGNGRPTTGYECSLQSWYSRHKNDPEIIEAVKKTRNRKYYSIEYLVNFCEKEKRMPRVGDKGLYDFALRNRENEVVKGLFEKYSQSMRYSTIEKLRNWCETNGRLPRGGKSSSVEESNLQSFMSRNKTNHEIIELIEKYDPNKEFQKTYSTIEELCDWCKKEGRLPKDNKAADRTERRLSQFLLRLRHKSEPRAMELVRLYSDKSINQKIQEFYNLYGRFPRESSLIEEERVLGEKLVKDPDKALNGVKVTLAPIVYRDFEQFTMAQQCEILSILGLPQQFIDETCKGRKKKATTKTLKEVFKNHGAELVESKDQKEQTSKSITEIGRIKRFSVVMAEYKADPHSPYLINESLNGLWDTIITESKYGSTSTYNELVSDTEQTEFFNIIKNQLVEEYKKATEYIPSREYSGKYNPDLMQRLCIIRLREKKYYANWSKTGTGKTLQSLLSSLDINSKITLYILPNSTVSDKAGTKKKDGAIKEFIPNSNVIIYNGSTSLKSIIPGKRNYILVNYDKLSRVRFLRPLEDLAKEGKIDFICVDEVQMAKSRGDKAASNRNKALLALRRLAEDYNPNLYVLGLTATPVINNLYEVKTLCEIITGKSLGDDGLFSGNTISFAAAQTAHKYIVNYGFRYNYDYSKEIAEKETIIPIRGGKDLYSRINEINDKFKDPGKSRRGMAGIKELEDSQIILKLEACKHLIKPGVVIYTQYVGGEKENNTITIINRWLRQNGLESVLYTGQMNDLTEDEETGEQIKIRDEELQRFIGDPEKGIIGSNKTKVLIASSVLRTGVDGLQKVSNTVIMLSLPWTYADYEQLKGRFIRRNSSFNEVNIYIPTVSLKLTTGEWSWDKSKWEILQYKKDLSDLIIYGNYCDSNILRIAQTETERSLIEKALSQIDAPLEIYSEEIHPDIDYQEVKGRLGNPRPYRRPKGSCIIHIHKRYDTMDTVEIEGDMAAPERRGSMTDYWIDQDSIVRKSGYVDPNTETSYLIQDVYGGLDKKVADLGCGPHDPLRKLVTNCEEFFSCTFEPEEVTLPLDVVRCDSTRLNMVEDKYFDVVNHTNSHWGTNLNDYVLEDYRILKDDGVLIITSVCPPRRNKYKIIANAYLESGLWEYLVEPIRFGGKSGMTRGIFRKKGI